jgi:hypothetical protein
MFDSFDDMTENLFLLLVTNDAASRLHFSAAAEMAFPRVVCFFALDCPQLIRQVESGQHPFPGFVFVDWDVMPTQKAVQCLRELQEATELMSTCLFVVSGNPALSDHNLLIDLRVQKVIEKSASLQQFSDAIFKAVYEIP